MDTGIFTPQVKPPTTAIVVSHYPWHRRVSAWESCPRCRENLDERLTWHHPGFITCQSCGAVYAPILPF